MYSNPKLEIVTQKLHVDRFKNCAQNIVEVGITTVRDD